MGTQSGRKAVITKRDDHGVRHTAALVFDPNDPRAPPKFVLRFVNGKPVDAMQLQYQHTGGHWVVIGADYAVFDTATGRGRVLIQVSYSLRGGQLANTSQVSRLQFADITAVVRKLFSPSLAYAAEAGVEDDPCATCTPLFWSAVGLSTIAAAAAAVEAAAVAACLSGDVPICLEIEALHAVTVAAVAAAGAAWAAYNACKQRGGGDEERVSPPANSYGSGRGVPIGKLTTEACEDPDPNQGGGGGATSCWTEHWTVEISYDGGATWSVLWEDDVEVCDYAI